VCTLHELNVNLGDISTNASQLEPVHWLIYMA